MDIYNVNEDNVPIISSPSTSENIQRLFFSPQFQQNRKGHNVNNNNIIPANQQNPIRTMTPPMFQRKPVIQQIRDSVIKRKFNLNEQTTEFDDSELYSTVNNNSDTFVESYEPYILHDYNTQQEFQIKSIYW